MPTQKDPTTFGYQNFYSTTLTGDITSGTLTIGLATVPTPTSGILIIEPDSTSSREVVFYTSKGASTITCPSDGRGWSGTSASAHLTGSTVIMASVDEYFEGLADGTLSTDPLRTSAFGDFIVSGGVVAQSAGLAGTFSNIVFYLNGQRYSGTSIAGKTYTASKDTYVDITAASGGAVSVTYTEVANNAASPSLAANYIRVAKVVTNGSAITSVTQAGNDSINNPIYPYGAVRGGNITQSTYNWYSFRTGTVNTTAAGSFAFTALNGGLTVTFPAIAGQVYEIVISSTFVAPTSPAQYDIQAQISGANIIDSIVTNSAAAIVGTALYGRIPWTATSTGNITVTCGVTCGGGSQSIRTDNYMVSVRRLT